VRGGEIMRVKIPQLLWYDNSEMELDFPPPWSVFFCPMKGGERKKLTSKEMEKAFQKPIGSKTIQELAKGKKEVAILFDDMARATPVYEIAPLVIRELEKAGVSDQQIRFIAALGAHGANTAVDFRKKLGGEMLDRFSVYNHHPFNYCNYLGKTSRGTPVSINREVMACDLKIGSAALSLIHSPGLEGAEKSFCPEWPTLTPSHITTGP